MRKIAIALASAFTLLLAAPASAQSTPSAVRDSTVHRHLGFLVRPYLGFGYLATSIPSSIGDVRLDGVAAQLGVVVGGAIQENLILGGEFYVSAVGSPSATQGGQSVTIRDTTFGNIGIGPNLTYYFMPVNMYVSVTPALTRITLTENSQSANSDWGFGGRAAVGKEWWVSDHWGLGLAGQFTYSTNSPGGNAYYATSNATCWGTGLVFSATYN